MNWKIALMALCAGFATPAHADWYEASGDHFVIYADDSEKDIRAFAENLEKYHAAMTLVTGRKVERPSPSNRVVIFVVGNQKDIRRVTGSDSRTVAGLYVPRAGASRAFVQDIRNKNGYPHISTIILLHEYAHHFLISTSRYAMPLWMSEGAAEFFASASFDKDGGVMIGRPALHRGGELSYAGEVTVHQLLDPELYERERGRGYDAFYGMSWALYHYLTFNDARRGQLSEYWLEVARGKPSIEAARAVFGDIDQLDKEVSAYLRQRRMYSLPVRADRLVYSPVTLRALPEGEAEMIDVQMRSQHGVTRDQALELVAEARIIAARYPDDPGVQTALAEAEFDAGFDDAAIAAADRAIAADPSRTNAYVQKGYALFRKAEQAKDKDAAYAEAMKPFTALNKIENDHPLPLIYYYRTFVERGVEPTDRARHAMERALEMAPFDQPLALNVALMQADEGKIALARATLTPVAVNPHGGGLSETARTFLDQLETAAEGTPWKPEFGIEALEEVMVEAVDSED